MTPYLNIPLSRNRKTTRHHSRWVVWFFVLCIIVGILLSWRIVDVFLTRDTVFEAAPEHTAVMVRFHPSQNTWDDLSCLLGQTTLISNRPITIRDIQPFVKGEFAVFFDEQGGKSLGIRASEKEIPKDLLDKLGISIQKINRQLFLLSETLMPIGGKPKGIYSRSSFLSLGTIGSLSLKMDESSWISGPIAQKNDQINIILPNPGIKPDEEMNIPENTLAALSIQGLTLLDHKIISTSLSNLVGLENGFFTILEENINGSLNILLVKNDSGEDFQYLLSTKTSKNKEEMIRLLKQVVATNEPTVENWELKDGSHALEMVADPSNISHEEINIVGTPLVRFSMKNGNEIHFWQENDIIILSNSFTLTGQYLEQHSDIKMGVFYLDIEKTIPFVRNREMFGSEYFSVNFLSNIRVFEIKTKGSNVIFTIK
ncbi:TPA: hypothetical protein DEP34_03970 [Candidatus Uhrbacteria bacterium]|uniref:Uncharacterized protein n=2 Tax=Candidatus Uhriibacteriota TaxID=1752732 RepID=A0A0G1Q957_9BACT|nr:MAG: hypothetical protein UX45_C0005G0027 [Candidatus Uhrbacteria bacterium GW2011_GWF2_46_218]KKU41534.1 MAG: hypothetical protein UX57_C0003G0034 [Candidatus Uhrbacteria bacterium GW2011_GWE2_46_68]HBK33535.1 hypothetical protein [Candidatus Uhrbacteria bacterium]HCB19510.1 hypothetical protein [Candidatus Uhrbacteria bacterium]